MTKGNGIRGDRYLEQGIRLDEAMVGQEHFGDEDGDEGMGVAVLDNTGAVDFTRSIEDDYTGQSNEMAQTPLNRAMLEYLAENGATTGAVMTTALRESTGAPAKMIAAYRKRLVANKFIQQSANGLYELTPFGLAAHKANEETQ